MVEFIHFIISKTSGKNVLIIFMKRIYLIVGSASCFKCYPVCPFVGVDVVVNFFNNGPFFSIRNYFFTNLENTHTHTLVTLYEHGQNSRSILNIFALRRGPIGKFRFAGDTRKSSLPRIDRNMRGRRLPGARVPRPARYRRGYGRRGQPYPPWAKTAS